MSKEFIYLFNLSEVNFIDSLAVNKFLIIQHLQFLKELKKDNNLILAGTTLDDFCEIVIIKCNDRGQAEEILKNDPYVKKNIFPVTLYDFRASLVLNEIIEEVKIEDGVNVEVLYKNPSNQYLGIITPRPTFIDDMTEDESKVMTIHYQYLKNRYDKKKLILAGPILAEGTFGVSVLLAESIDEADQFQKQDPSVMAGIMEPEVHPFRVFFLGTK
ncbi:MAG: hypothetical protein H7641_04900 [Candidatus Heimdallarchaeota archaeon]|nr:hypothetical protein [Candidatus Heimdallarchaeota archaeon]MCK4876898.1 hypothetical protein [Candidatus Heimdallarchaeota archaeon]